MTKEKWMEFCKKVAPHMDAIRAEVVKAGIPEETCASIAVCADGYVTIDAMDGDVIYDCAAVGENEYKLSIFGGEKDTFGTIPRSWEGGEEHDTGGKKEDSKSCIGSK